LKDNKATKTIGENLRVETNIKRPAEGGGANPKKEGE